MTSSTPGKAPSATASIKPQPLRGEGIALARPTQAQPAKPAATRSVPKPPIPRPLQGKITTVQVPLRRPARNITAKQEIRK